MEEGVLQPALLSKRSFYQSSVLFKCLVAIACDPEDSAVVGGFTALLS